MNHPLDIIFRDERFTSANDRLFQGLVAAWIEDVFASHITIFTIFIATRSDDGIEVGAGQFGTGNKGCHFLFFQNLPVDVAFDVRVIDINGDHFGCAPCGAAGFDGTGCAVPNFEEAHQAR